MTLYRYLKGKAVGRCIVFSFISAKGRISHAKYRLFGKGPIWRLDGRTVRHIAKVKIIEDQETLDVFKGRLCSL